MLFGLPAKEKYIENWFYPKRTIEPQKPLLFKESEW